MRGLAIVALQQSLAIVVLQQSIDQDEYKVGREGLGYIYIVPYNLHLSSLVIEALRDREITPRAARHARLWGK